MNFNNAQFEKAFGTFEQLDTSDLPEICFSGRSNVGKSSLINKVLNRKSIARVSSKPGKTVTINFYKVDKVRLVDLPGYGYAKRSKEEVAKWEEMRIEEHMDYYLQQGIDKKEAMKMVAKDRGITKRDVYQQLLG